MHNLQKGGNVLLSQAGISSSNIFAGISWVVINCGKQVDIDVSAFLLNEQDKVNSDDDFIFYNQADGPNGSVVLDSDPDNGNDVRLFSIAIDKLPAYVRKIVFVATIDNAAERGQDFNSVSDLCIRVFEPDAFNEKTIDFKVTQVSKETSIALGELYLHQATWKFRALGQGFESGLAEMAKGYGVELADNNDESNIQAGLVQITENSDRFADRTMVDNEIRINRQIKKLLPKIKNAIKQQLNESNTRMLLDRFFIDVLGYKMQEIKTEVKIQGRKADYVLSVGAKEVLVVEAKKVGALLKEEQIFQATSYGAYSGIAYVLLTNLNEFILFRVKTDGVVDTDVIFSVNLLEDFDIKEIKKLSLISRLGMTKPELLAYYCRQVIATSPENIARLLVSEDVLNAIQNAIKKEQDCDVTHEQIQETIEVFLEVTAQVYS